MEFRNDRGSPIDPTPFFVVASLAFLVCYSYFPITLLEIGLSLSVALVVTTLGFVAATVLAYHRLVRTARPDLRGEIPLCDRLRNLIYAAVAATAVMALFALLAVAR
jgi:hypothetical protein